MLLSPLQQPIIVIKNSICLRETQKQIWKLPTIGAVKPMTI